MRASSDCTGPSVCDEHVAIFRAGHEWWTSNERWSTVMGMVYGDLSGSETDILTAACYLGHEPQWMHAIAEWDKVLKDAGVDEFHATDFYNAQGKFDDDRWRRQLLDGRMVPGGPLHDAFAARFCAIAPDTRLIGFAVAMDTAAFTEIFAPELAREGRKYPATNPRTWATMSSLSAISEYLAQTTYRDDGRIQVIFEHEHRPGKFVDFFEESRAREERWTYWFASFTTAPKSFIPLQLADLLAHEAWRRVKSLQSANPRPLRKSFERMLVGGNIAVRWLGRDGAQKNAQQARDLLTQFPDGMVPPEYTRDA